MSKRATPNTAPELKPSKRCRRSRNRKAAIPPSPVDTSVAAARIIGIKRRPSSLVMTQARPPVRSSFPGLKEASRIEHEGHLRGDVNEGREGWIEEPGGGQDHACGVDRDRTDEILPNDSPGPA